MKNVLSILLLIIVAYIVEAQNGIDTVTYTEFIQLKNNNNLTPYRGYVITDRTDTIRGRGQGAGTTGNIYALAYSSNAIQKECRLMGYNPDYANRKLWKSNTTEIVVIWDGFTWRYNSGDKSQKPGMGIVWSKNQNEVPFNDLIYYNADLDQIYYRSDGSSEISYDITWLDYFWGTYMEAFYTLNHNPIDLYCWGNSYVFGNIAKNATIENYNSGAWAACYGNVLENFSVLKYYSGDNTYFVSIYSNYLMTSSLIIDTLQNTHPTKILSVIYNEVNDSYIHVKKWISNSTNPQSYNGICNNIFHGSFLIAPASVITNGRFTFNDLNNSYMYLKGDCPGFYTLTNKLWYSDLEVSGNNSGAMLCELSNSKNSNSQANAIHANNVVLKNIKIDNLRSNLDTTMTISGNIVNLDSYKNSKFGVFKIVSTSGKATISNITNCQYFYNREFEVQATGNDTIYISNTGNINISNTLCLLGKHKEYVKFKYYPDKLQVIGGVYSKL